LAALSARASCTFCLQSTESEISSDEISSETKVSYNEFLKQYNELTDWLGQMRLLVRQQAESRSENYLTHVSIRHHLGFSLS